MVKCYFYKVVSLLAGMTMVVALFGCSDAGSSLEDKKVDEAAHALLDAIQHDDLGEAWRYISDAACTTSDLQQGLDYANSVLGGTIKSIDVLPKMERYTVENGKSLRYKMARYDVHTQYGHYYLRFEYYLKNDFDESKNGVFRIYFDTYENYQQEIEQIQKEKERADANNQPLPEWNYGATYERPGIYHPGWKEEAA